MAESFYCVLDIGGTKILGAIFNSKKEIVYRLKKKTKADGEDTQNVEDTIISVVDEMLGEFGIKPSQVKAIAAGAPGVIDQEKGIVLTSPNLPWTDYDIRTPIEKKFGTKFYIGNDVNVGVLGEYKYGSGNGYKNIVGLFVGTGMGGGLILDGKLYTGHKFKGAEYGHMILDPEGPLCNCGQRGCLEAFSSKQGMSSYIRQQVSRGRECVMADAITGSAFKSKALKNALSPELVVYGGGVIEAVGDIFLQKILSEVDRYCMPSIRKTVEFKTAALGDDSILYGGLSMILEK